MDRPQMGNPRMVRLQHDIIIIMVDRQYLEGIAGL